MLAIPWVPGSCAGGREVEAYEVRRPRSLGEEMPGEITTWVNGVERPSAICRL
jgi:hypothetical protein